MAAPWDGRPPQPQVPTPSYQPPGGPMPYGPGLPPRGPGLPPDGRSRGGGLPDGLLLALIAFLLAGTALVWTGTGLAALLAHGHWPAGLHFTQTPQAVRTLATKPLRLAAAWPQVPPADLPRPGLFWGILVSQVMVLLVLLAFAVGTLARLRAARAARRQAPAPAADPAPLPAAQPPYGTSGTAAAAPSPPPTPAMPPPPTPGWEAAAEPAPMPLAGPLPGGTTAGGTTAGSLIGAEPLPGQLAGAHLLVTGSGPGRARKGQDFVQPAVLDAEGAVLVTCADDTTWRHTVAARGKLGPALVFDPEHLVDTPGRLRWAPHTGCEDPATATARARALLAPMRGHDVTADEAAITLLRCWLHAAAVDGLPFRQLHRWATGGGSAEAVRILRTARDAAPGWSGELESTLHAHPDRRDTAQEAIRRALDCLGSLHIRDACGPGRSESLDLESWLAERGTLYVVGTPREEPRTEPGAMPLLSALVSSVVEHGRSMAARSSAGRLDPPLTCVLDDIAVTAPLPELPALMREGPALGLPTLAVLRSEEQARHRWPARDAATIWQHATSNVTL